jgi:glutathione S-transferase
VKLFHNPASPFVRKVLVTAHETGQADQIELLTISSTPVEPNAALRAQHPLAKIPALVLDDGSTLYDSRVICEYLDARAGGTLFPAAGPPRWTALRRQALADGLADAAILIRYEHGFRDEGLRSEAWIAGQFVKFRGALDALEAEADELGPAVTIGEIAIGCALGYLDFRFAAENWRETRPALATFYSAFEHRPSMLITQPPPV